MIVELIQLLSLPVFTGFWLMVFAAVVCPFPVELFKNFPTVVRWRQRGQDSDKSTAKGEDSRAWQWVFTALPALVGLCVGVLCTTIGYLTGAHQWEWLWAWCLVGGIEASGIIKLAKMMGRYALRKRAPAGYHEPYSEPYGEPPAIPGIDEPYGERWTPIDGDFIGLPPGVPAIPEDGSLDDTLEVDMEGLRRHEALLEQDRKRRNRGKS